MHSFTIREAKARLNALVEAAERGEQVVLMRGSRHVAQIVPLVAQDLEVAPRLSDGQAERLWRELSSEARDGAGVVKESAEAAVAFLSRKKSHRRGRKHLRKRRPSRRPR
jgi:antitoxin (DNA-binding transcriptional repressor) of toxin-antitoxin stability system